MKKNIIILCLSICMIVAKSQTSTQTEKYIEVKVSDTIKVSPDYVEAFVKLKKENNPYNYYDFKDKEEESTKSAKEISTTILKKDLEKKISEVTTNYQFIEKAEKNFMSKELDIWNDGYLVKLNSIEEYNNLEEKIDKENASVSMKTMEIRNDEAHNERLLIKTMKSASTEANLIAKLMKVEIDKPIMIKNYNSNEYNTGDMFGAGGNNYISALMGMMGSMFQNANKETQVTLTKTLIVRYSYK